MRENPRLYWFGNPGQVSGTELRAMREMGSRAPRRLTQVSGTELRVENFQSVREDIAASIRNGIESDIVLTGKNE